ncbi:unnamed protein product, partial [Rotaria sp. Silwood1]
MTRYLLFLLTIIFTLIYIPKISSSDSKSPIIFIPGSFCSLVEVRINTTLQPSCPISLHNQWILLWLNIR